MANALVGVENKKEGCSGSRIEGSKRPVQFPRISRDSRIQLDLEFKLRPCYPPEINRLRGMSPFLPFPFRILGGITGVLVTP
jgi:hypothetical protein